MKIAIECRSPLLQKSLENFLQGHLSSVHSCDVVLSDEEIPGRSNLLRIGTDADADIIKPFSKSQLFLKLEQYFKNEEEAIEVMAIANELDNMDDEISYDDTIHSSELRDRFSSLEEKIERLTASYVKGVMTLVREHYEKE